MHRCAISDQTSWCSACFRQSHPEMKEEKKVKMFSGLGFVAFYLFVLGFFLCSQLCNSFNYELTRWCFIVLEITSIQPPVQCSHVSSAYTENCSFPVIRWRWSDVLLLVGFLSFACFFQKKIIYLLSKQLLLVKLVWRCLQFTQRN